MPQYCNIGVTRSNTEWAKFMPTIPDDAQLSVTEAMELAGMLYDHHMGDAFGGYEDDEGTYHWVQMEGTRAMIRPAIKSDPVDRPLGFRGTRYNVLQHNMMGEILDPLTDKWPVATVGVLADWRISVVALDMGSFIVGGQEREIHTSHLILSDDKRGAGSAHWGLLSERGACRNRYAHAVTNVGNKIPHTWKIETELKFRRDIEVFAIRRRATAIEQFDLMLKSFISDEEAKQIVNAAFPFKQESRITRLANSAPEIDTEAADHIREFSLESEKIKDQRNEWAMQQREEALQNLSILNADPEFVYAHGTAYAAFQAVTQQLNHSDMYRGDEAKNNIRLVFGDHAKSMHLAHSAAMKTVISKN